MTDKSKNIGKAIGETMKRSRQNAEREAVGESRKELQDDSGRDWLKMRGLLDTYGLNALSEFRTVRVILFGLKGLGVEIAKNLVLSGVESLTICDDSLLTTRDLGTNFLLKEKDVGKCSSVACLEPLRSLNPSVRVSLHKGKLTKEVVSHHDVFVDCGLNIEEAKRWNKFCRRTARNNQQARQIAYVKSRVHGLAAYTFVDFGNGFIIDNKTLEEPISRSIVMIEVMVTNVNGVVKHQVIVHLSKRGLPHGLKEDEHHGYVNFENVDGHLGGYLNNKGPFRIRQSKSTSSSDYELCVEIPEAASLPKYTGGGMIVQERKPIPCDFISLEESIKLCCEENKNVNTVSPHLIFGNHSFDGNALDLHNGMCALWEYEMKYGKLPAANDPTAEEEVLELLSEARYSDRICNHDVVKKLVRFAECQFQPLCALFGGIVATEIFKISGNFVPIQQWLYLDTFELAFNTNPKTLSQTGTRYDDLITIFGAEAHREIMNLRTMLIGCGPVGWELMKNFALLGIGSDVTVGAEGLVTLVNNEMVQPPDLASHLMLCENDVGKSKVQMLQEVANRINPNMSMKAETGGSKIQTKDVDAIGQDKWKYLDVVFSVGETRAEKMFVDEQCIFYSKPCLECNVFGSDFETQVIIPHVTESYQPPPFYCPDTRIYSPYSRMKSPHGSLEDPFIGFALNTFEREFFVSIKNALEYTINPNQWVEAMKSQTLRLGSRSLMLRGIQMNKSVLEEVYRTVIGASRIEKGAHTCIIGAYRLFQIYFADQIEAHKRVRTKNEGFQPRVAIFNVKNNLHLEFIVSCSNLIAINFGWISPGDSIFAKNTAVEDIIQDTVNKFDFKTDVYANPNHMFSDEMTNDETIQVFEKTLTFLDDIAGSGPFSSLNLQPIEIPKKLFPGSMNGLEDLFLDFVTSSSNIRAWTFNSELLPRYKQRMIVDGLKPTTVSTSATASAFLTIELLKLIQPETEIESFQRTSGCSCTNMYVSSNPQPPEVIEDGFSDISMNYVFAQPAGFTIWDRTVIKGEYTLREFLRAFQRLTDLRCTMLYHPNANNPKKKGFSKFIFSTTFMLAREQEMYDRRMDIPLTALLFDIYGYCDISCTTSSTSVQLECMAEDNEQNEYTIPWIEYDFVYGR